MVITASVAEEPSDGHQKEAAAVSVCDMIRELACVHTAAGVGGGVAACDLLPKAKMCIGSMQLCFHDS